MLNKYCKKLNSYKQRAEAGWQRLAEGKGWEWRDYKLLVKGHKVPDTKGLSIPAQQTDSSQ